MVENDVYETKKKFRKRDLFLAVYKMSSSMLLTLNSYNDLIFNAPIHLSHIHLLRLYYPSTIHRHRTV
jgi:hypothetical protein